MVEEIEKLRSELKTDSLGNRCALEYCEIPVIGSGCSEGGIHARLSTKTPIRWGCKAGGVEPLRNVASARRFATSGRNVRTYVGDTKVGGFQGSCGASPGNLQREAALEGSLSVDSPTGNHFVRHSSQASREPLAMPKGEIEDIADHQSLRNILRGEGLFSFQIVPILNLPDAAGRTFQPTGQGIGVAQEFRIGIGHQHGTAAGKAPCYRGLQGVVGAATATEPR